MNDKAPTYIYPKGARVLYTAWVPEEKESHVMFRCGACDGVFSHEKSKLTIEGPIQCGLCKAEYYVSMNDAIAIRRKIVEIRRKYDQQG